MRNKHSCQICGEPFSRRWNLERHIKRRHPSDLRSLLFPFQDTNHPETKSPKFKSHTPNYYSSYSNSHNSSNIFPRSSLIEDSSIYEQTNTLRHINNPFHSCLVMLRKTVEIKKLIQELSSTSIRQPQLFPYTGAFSQSHIAHSLQPEIRIQDLEIIGYKGYICKECLTAHPLAICNHKYESGAKLIQTKHGCHHKRILEIQQGQQKYRNEADLADLYMNQLPELMLRCVREWIKGQALLMAIEVSSPFDGCHEMVVSYEKQWAVRAIRFGATVLTDEELADFMNTVRDCTYAYFKIADNKMNKNLGRVYFMYVGSGHQ
jgi:hypothetical protein